MRHFTILFASLLLTTSLYSQTEEEQVFNMLNDSLKVNPKSSNWLF